MKTKFIPILITAAAICVSRAQTTPSTSKTSDRVAYEIGAENRESPRSTATLNQQDDELQAEKEKLAMLRLKYTEVHPEVVAAKNRIAQLEGSSAYQRFSSSGGGSIGRFGQRLQAVVRRGDSALPGSIILTSAMSQEKLDQLSEDLTVLNYIFTRSFERTFGEKGTEYRLGVPITMSGGRFVETSYIEGFGVLVKVQVPFAVVSSGDEEKKSEPAPKTDSEWEKARRALFGNADAEGAAPSAEPAATYDEKVVGELKKQIFDALKSAANIRNLDANQAITVVIVGGPNFPTRRAPRTGVANDVRSTVMTIRITKAQADAAAKNPEANDLSKDATMVGYFDIANASSAPRGFTAYGGGGYGSGFGGGYGGVGAYPSAAPATR
jgi:hypothetical protein